jgi:hypothetical protein
VTAAGLLFLFGVNGVAFSVSASLEALIAAAPTDAAVIAVHLLISAISFALLALFLRGLASRQRPAAPPIIGAHG